MMERPKRKKKQISAHNLLIVLVCLLIVVLVGIIAVACTMLPQDDTPPVTEPPTDPPRNGWIFEDGNRYFYDNDVALTGAQTIDGVLYCFGEDGAMLSDGWQTVDGKTYYLNADGTAYYGWLELEGERYYLQADGTMLSDGWQTVDGKTYYLNADGTAYYGWLELEGERYYLQADGTIAQGTVVMDEQTWFFTSQGCQFYVVNPWNHVPQDYTVDIKYLPAKYGSGQGVDASCYEALMQMLDDGTAAGYGLYVLSSYRTHETQEWLYNNQVNKQMNKGYSREEAEKIAATISAIPGTSEHQLGLAVDIIDTQIWDLVEEQENLEGQKWLMEHCWEYGFVLRYPKDGRDSTGIIYEPWHYRYVGKELAAELHELGLTVEQYLNLLDVDSE